MENTNYMVAYKIKTKPILIEFLKLRKLEVETNRIIDKLYPKSKKLGIDHYRTFFKDVRKKLGLIVMMQRFQKGVLEDLKRQLEARK